MSKIFKDLKIKIEDDLEQHLAWLMPDHGPYRILKQSVDARQKHSPHFVYSVEVAEKDETLKLEVFSLSRLTKNTSSFKKSKK